MPQYDWSRVIGRNFWALLIGALWVMLSHGVGEGFVGPVRWCNGGWQEALVFLLQFGLAITLIEGLHWLAWYWSETRRRTRQGPPTSENVIADAARVSGGALLAPRGFLWSLALALSLFFAVRRFSGYVPDPCDPAGFSRLSWKGYGGWLAFGYAMLVLCNLIASSLERSAGTPPIQPTE